MGRGICWRNVFTGKKRDLSRKDQTRQGNKIYGGSKMERAYLSGWAKLIESTLDAIRGLRLGAGRPRKLFPRLIYDKAADSLRLRVRLRKERGIDLICPHRSNCKKRVQDGRKLRRYSRRWIIERTNAWLQNFRRIVVRYDRFLSSYTAFVTLWPSHVARFV